MKPTTMRQKYFSIVARLYEIAADYSEEEIREMLEVFGKDAGFGVRRALDGLAAIHSAEPPMSARDQLAFGVSDIVSKREARANTSLFSLLVDRELFPATADISDVLPKELAPQPKESRERYARRVVKHIHSLEASERINVMGKVLNYIGSKKSPGFVETWKTLIRDM